MSVYKYSTVRKVLLSGGDLSKGREVFIEKEAVWHVTYSFSHFTCILNLNQKDNETVNIEMSLFSLLESKYKTNCVYIKYTCICT